MRMLRWIWIVLGLGIVGVGLAAGIGAAWLNSFIHSDDFRHQIEARAGQSLGGTVKIDRINFDIFHGIKLEGMAYRAGSSATNGNTLQASAERVNCTYACKELFHRRLELTGVNLQKPQVIITQGGYSALATVTGTPPAGSIPPAGPPAASSNSQPFVFILNHAKIVDGSASFRADSGATLVDLHGIDAQADTAGYYNEGLARGSLHIAEIVAGAGGRISDFSTPVSYGQGTLQAKPFTATAYGGSLAGGYESAAAGISVLDLNARGVAAGQLLTAMNPSSPAKLNGSLDWQSKWRGIETGAINGEGDAQLTDGKLEEVKILHQLSSILRIRELDSPAITKAQTHFVVASQQMNFTGLQLDSPFFQLTGDGVLAFNGGISGDLVLNLGREAMRRLPKEAAASFVQKQDGSGSIKFQVTGTLDHPQTDLAARLLMQNAQIQSVISKQLNKFFNHLHKQQDSAQPSTDSSPLTPPPDANTGNGP